MTANGVEQMYWWGECLIYDGSTLGDPLGLSDGKRQHEFSLRRTTVHVTTTGSKLFRLI